LTPPQCKIITTYCTSNYRLTIESRQWTTIPISGDTSLCHLCFYDAIINEAHFMLECPLDNSIRDKFPSLFENIVLESLKSYLQLDHQVDISLYLTEATILHHSRELISWCETIPLAFLASWPSWRCLKPLQECLQNRILRFSYSNHTATHVTPQTVPIALPIRPLKHQSPMKRIHQNS
jgi:hypothetical protein